MSKNYEVIDNTADIIIHAWGRTLKEAFQSGVKGMFGYMTDLDKVEERTSIIIDAKFETESSKEEMLFRVLDECLVQFSIQDHFFFKRLEIKEMDNEGFMAVAYGESMDLKKHTHGPEIHAVTMQGLSIQEGDRVDIHFLVNT